MDRRKLFQHVMWAVMIMFLLVGCNAPASTPTSESLPEPAVELGEVIFDGTECTYTGRTELMPGRYSLVLKDLSDIDVNVYVGRMTDDKTYQDFVDIQTNPDDPYEYVPAPDFVNYSVEPRAAVHRPDGGAVHTYIFSVVGEYAIVIGRESPFYIGFCSPFWVVDDFSD